MDDPSEDILLSSLSPIRSRVCPVLDSATDALPLVDGSSFGRPAADQRLFPSLSSLRGSILVPRSMSLP